MKKMATAIGAPLPSRFQTTFRANDGPLAVVRFNLSTISRETGYTCLLRDEDLCLIPKFVTPEGITRRKCLHRLAWDPFQNCKTTAARMMLNDPVLRRSNEVTRFVDLAP